MFGTEKAPIEAHQDQEAIDEFLNSLRESGTINMFEAPAHIQDAFDMPKHEARRAFQHWADNFSA